MQSLSLDISPRIYYTVSELNVVKDVTILKSASVKTIGYLKGERLYGINFESLHEATDAADNIALDLTYQNIDFASDKPHMLQGLLYTVNSTPVLLVKSAKQLDSDFGALTSYHKYWTAIRMRTKHFQDLKYIAKENKWI